MTTLLFGAVPDFWPDIWLSHASKQSGKNSKSQEINTFHLLEWEAAHLGLLAHHNKTKYTAKRQQGSNKQQGQFVLPMSFFLDCEISQLISTCWYLLFCNTEDCFQDSHEDLMTHPCGWQALVDEKTTLPQDQKQHIARKPDGQTDGWPTTVSPQSICLWAQIHTYTFQVPL